MKDPVVGETDSLASKKTTRFPFFPIPRFLPSVSQACLKNRQNRFNRLLPLVNAFLIAFYIFSNFSQQQKILLPVSESVSSEKLCCSHMRAVSIPPIRLFQKNDVRDDYLISSSEPHRSFVFSLPGVT